MPLSLREKGVIVSQMYHLGQHTGRAPMVIHQFVFLSMLVIPRTQCSPLPLTFVLAAAAPVGKILTILQACAQVSLSLIGLT